MARTPAVNPKETTASVRISLSERQEMEENAKVLGFRSLSDYIRHLHKESVKKNTEKKISVGDHQRSNLVKFHETHLGTMFNGDSLDYLFYEIPENSVDLIMTSPPFGLVRKKSYGNEDAHNYCNWFRPFAEGFKRVLKDSGSLVIDIGGAWKPGIPTRSLYHFELLLMLCEEYGFHLCQEHYWWNPAKLPTPAEWVNIRRVRVKDAVNCVWWLSPTPYPKANNKRVLAPYSDSMKDLLKNGYQAKTRPSGHVISEKFSKDNGGSVPPNLLAIANTESNGHYQDYCREKGMDIHPARFPSLLPEYFIRFLTNPRDMVVDPFAGSCVTGLVAENLGRKWACIEMNSVYLHGALARFQGDIRKNSTTRPSSYFINTPCSVPVNGEEIPLVDDGGKTRQNPAGMVKCS